MRRFLLTMMIAIFTLTFISTAFAENYYLSLPVDNVKWTDHISVIVPAENPAIEGINPMTGEAWYGRYTPILVSTDNQPDALPHWGVSSADIIYEIPLHTNGATRQVVVYMGTIPRYVGPIRSGRVYQASLRQMWGGAFVFYGVSEDYNAPTFERRNAEFDVLRFISLTNGKEVYNNMGLLTFPFFNGLYGGTIGAMFHRAVDKEHAYLHSVQVDTQAVLSYFTNDPVMHPFKFTETGLDHGINVSDITVSYGSIKGDGDYTTSFKYNPMFRTYIRYRNGQEYYDGLNMQTCEFANVIVLRTDVHIPGKDGSRIIAPLYGQGTAEIFQNGKYIRGTWVRTNSPTVADQYASQPYRMVFLDDYGQELEMKVGKTCIQVVDEDQPVTVVAEQAISGGIPQASPVPTATPAPTRTPHATRTPKPGQETPAPVAEPSGDAAETEGDVEFDFGG